MDTPLQEHLRHHHHQPQHHHTHTCQQELLSSSANSKAKTTRAAAQGHSKCSLGPTAAEAWVRTGGGSGAKAGGVGAQGGGSAAQANFGIGGQSGKLSNNSSSSSVNELTIPPSAPTMRERGGSNAGLTLNINTDTTRLRSGSASSSTSSMLSTRSGSAGLCRGSSDATLSIPTETSSSGGSRLSLHPDQAFSINGSSAASLSNMDHLPHHQHHSHSRHAHSQDSTSHSAECLNKPNGLDSSTFTSISSTLSTSPSLPHAHSRSSLADSNGHLEHDRNKENSNLFSYKDNGISSPGQGGTPILMASTPNGSEADLFSPLSEPATTEAQVKEISEILPNFLYLGAELKHEDQMDELERLGIKRVLNMAENCEDKVVLDRWHGKGYLKVPLRDHVEQDLGEGLLQAIEFIASSTDPIYVHCHAGKSRSVATVIGYLLQELHWPLKKAYDHVVAKRNCMSPNIGFVSQLIQLEETVFGAENSKGLITAVGAAEDIEPGSRTTVVQR